MKKYLALMITITIMISLLLSTAIFGSAGDMQTFFSDNTILTEETGGDEEDEEVFYASLFHLQLAA